MGKATALAFCIAVIYLQDGVICPPAVQQPALIEGDMALSTTQTDIRQKAIQSKGTKTMQDVAEETFGASSTAYKRWPRGVVPYTIDNSLYYNTRGKWAIKAAMQEWEAKTCIRFKKRTNERNYLEFFRNNGCWGHVGMGNGKSQISVGSGCEHRHVMTHEIGHSIGFWHEQSRTDRDQYIKILWANIGKFKSAFDKYGIDKLDSLGVPYDYGSIMHYPWNAFSSNGRPTVQPLRRVTNLPYQTLSASDAKQTMLMYHSCRGKTKPPKPKPPPTVPPPPTDPPEPTDKPPITECKEVEVSVRVFARQTCYGDLNQYCRSWANTGYCTRNAAYMRTNCCRSCPQPRPPARRQNCNNHNRNCQSWAAKGECRKNPSYMRTQCCKACGGGGGGNNNCRDDNRLCPGWARRGECRKNPDYMLKSCKRSCRKCSGKKKVIKCNTIAPPVVPMTPPPPPTDPPIRPPKPTLPPLTGTPPPLPPVPSDCVIPVAAGLEDSSMADSSLTVSSSSDSDHSAKHGRLQGSSSWCAKVNDQKQFLQIDLGKLTLVKKIQTQGGDASKYVKKYAISYSETGDSWNEYVSTNMFWAVKEFLGNTDKNTVITNEFAIPIVARYLKIKPVEWENQICLRMELLICGKKKPVPPKPPVEKKTPGPPPPKPPSKKTTPAPPKPPVEKITPGPPPKPPVEKITPGPPPKPPVEKITPGPPPKPPVEKITPGPPPKPPGGNL